VQQIVEDQLVPARIGADHPVHEHVDVAGHQLVEPRRELAAGLERTELRDERRQFRRPPVQRGKTAGKRVIRPDAGSNADSNKVVQLVAGFAQALRELLGELRTGLELVAERAAQPGKHVASPGEIEAKIGE
jgi:hypothetical protein